MEIRTRPKGGPQHSATTRHTDAPLIDIRSVGKIYEPSPPAMRVLLRSSILSPVTALRDVSFQVHAGEICAVVGPNGAGKSTLFRVLNGLTTPTTGSATVCGFDVTKQSFEVRRRIGFQSADDQSLLGRHSVRENLLFHGRLQGMSKDELHRRIPIVLEQVGIERASRRLGTALSSGMKARLQLARAILHQPQVLILDEPTGSLDPVAAYRFLEILREAVAEKAMAVLLSSHRLEEIEALSDHVLLLNQGQVVYDGNLDALRSHWDKTRHELRFPTPEAAHAAAEVLRDLPDVELASVEGETIVIGGSIRIGELFVAAGDALNAATSVAKVQMPLRDLLAELLSGEDAVS